MGVPGERAGTGRNGGTPELSAVVPVYGCRDCLQVLHARLSAALSDISPDYEIVLVDDRSPDRAWDVLEGLAERDPHTVAIRLSRNFGQHAAITAGLTEARGDWVVILDCDLQDPPEDIPRLYAKALDGYDIVFGRRKEKPTTWWRRQTARMYFRGLSVFSGASIDGQYGTFSLISRPVVDAFLRFKDKDRHYLFILYWLGFRTTSVDYEPAPRLAGESSYSLRTLI